MTDRIQKLCSIASLVCKDQSGNTTQRQSSGPVNETLACLQEIYDALYSILHQFALDPHHESETILDFISRIVSELSRIKFSQSEHFTPEIDSMFVKINRLAVFLIKLLEEYQNLEDFEKMKSESRHDIVNDTHHSPFYSTLSNQDYDMDQTLVFDIITQGMFSQNVKRPRRKIAKHQTAILTEWYNENLRNPYLTKESQDLLTRDTGLTAVQVRNWLANKRRKERNSTISDQLIGLL